MSAQIGEKKLDQWADYLINYSLDGVDENDRVMIKGEAITWPLMQILKRKVIQNGAIPDTFVVEPDNDRGQVWGAEMAKHGTLEQIKRVPEWMEERYENMTKYIEILGAELPDLFADLPSEKSSAIQKADMPLKEIRLSKPWVLTLFPTQAFADMEGMTLEEYTDIILNTSLTDPRQLEDVEQPIHDLMDESSEITIVTEHPVENRELTLKLDISDRNIIKCTGKNNFPDGEVFTSPDARSAEGEIFMDLPVFFDGVNIKGIYLKFEEGEIIDYNAQENGDALESIIETDEGSHRLGEVALGMNQGLETALKHPLFVEKVGGTLHIAIGKSYPRSFVDEPNSEQGEEKVEELKEKGIFNSSAQHVDIVADFREGGVGKAVYLDDHQLISEDNIWKVE